MSEGEGLGKGENGSRMGVVGMRRVRVVAINFRNF